MWSFKSTALDEYTNERELLNPHEISELLDSGKKWDISKSLSLKGSAIFPHTFIKECGDQIAAVVHGCLDSGADQILVLGVLHAVISDELAEVRQFEILGKDLSSNPIRGVSGPGLERSEFWKKEYSLSHFLFLFEQEVKRRGIKSPKLILRYPFGVNRSPETLPGIKELETITKDSIIVATSDLCHHGAAYKCPPEIQLDISEKGYQFATTCIQNGLDLLKTNDYEKYYQHCLNVKSDSYDVSPLLRHLLGPLKNEILDLKLIDAAKMFEGNPMPSWVAASLISLQPL